MSPDIVFWLAIVGLAAVFVAAVGARSLTDFSRHDLEEICRHRKPDRLGQILVRHDEAALAAEMLQVIAVAAAIGAGTCWVWLAYRPETVAPWLVVAASVGGGAAALLVVRVLLPYAFARLWAERILYHGWPLWRSVDLVFTPLVAITRAIDAALHRLIGRKAQTNEDSFEEEILTVVTEGHREGLLEEEARDMIEGIIELGDVDVASIMTPRTDMATIAAEMTWEEVLEFVRDSSHTRIPCHGKSRDEIIGILHVRDLIAQLIKSRSEPKPSWTVLLRPPYFVPETKPVDVLLQDFQQTRSHIAVVLDEYGGVSGLVTLEDALEEIVGEIVDEYDREEVDDIREIDASRIEALGRAHIDEVNERLALDLPEDADYDTIGGFVFSELGHVPVAGEVVDWKNVRITVLEATPRRIERVQVEVLNRVGGEAE